MNSIKFLLTPKFDGVPFNVLASAIANLELNEKMEWSFINEVDDEIIMESVIELNDGKTILISNACGGGYESSAEIDGLGDNIGIELALKKEYGEYKVKNIY